jgi:hypothetical protein
MTTYYVRDAQGNPLAVYEQQGGTITWREQQLYGSSRLDMWQPNINLTTATTTTVSTAYETLTGKKQYELSNHLGNVLATITDTHTQAGDGTFEPVVATAQDYYTFGSLMPGNTRLTRMQVALRLHLDIELIGKQKKLLQVHATMTYWNSYKLSR